MVAALLSLCISATPSFESAQGRCQGADLDACLALARYYADVRGEYRDFGKAQSLFQSLCTKNVGDACAELGSMHAEGRGGPRDAAKAVQLWERACNKGLSKLGCAALGTAYLEGVGGPKRIDEGERVLSAACAREWAPACLRLASHFASELEPAKRDARRAMHLVSQACLAGDAPSCLRGCEERLLGAPMPGTEADALADCQRACDGKQQRGCWGVGLLNLHTQLPGTSAKEAVAQLRSACREAEPRSCIALGELAEVGGGGMPRSPAAAKEHFTFAHLRLDSLCGKEMTLDCLMDAELKVQGRVKDEDAARTRTRLEGACTDASPRGCFGLGVARARGHGGAADLPGAVEAWTRGCSAGHASACRARGLALAKGTGVAADEAEAKRSLTVACDAWDGEACSGLADLVGGRKSPEGQALRKTACRHGYGPACR